MKFWSWYTTTIRRTVLTQKQQHENIFYYKDQLFYYIISYTLIFSPLAIIPGIIASILNDKNEIIVLNIVGFLVLLFLAFKKSIPLETRKSIFISLLLFVAWTLLFRLGLEGPGEIYLFAVTILTCFIKSIRDAYNIVLANSILLIFIALNIHFNWISLELNESLNLSEWIGTTVNIIFLSIIVVSCFRIIFRKLESIINRQKILNEKVKSDNVQMRHVHHALQDKNQELNQFAHTVAHDLKEPLRSMEALAGLTLTKYGGSVPDNAQEYISYIKTASKRTVSLLDSLLNYSQVGQNQNTSIFCVKDIIEELKKDLSQLIKENKAEITYSENLPQIKGYELEFKQLLQNLISNSIKFGKDDQRVKINIEVKDKDSAWEFLVTDNGIGIDPKHKEKIFSIFHRLHKDKYPGTGLGLANCKKIVEMHGGNIWVESNLNEGSTFYFTIQKEIAEPITNG